ncbi:hypothetical protein BKA60DRAFT_86671 [Fusarium oxysporum]|nr:hypothetical protein BKA60DRAFT_86671 [Fusarium oxysporum]
MFTVTLFLFVSVPQKAGLSLHHFSVHIWNFGDQLGDSYHIQHQHLQLERRGPKKQYLREISNVIFQLDIFVTLFTVQV